MASDPPVVEMLGTIATKTGYHVTVAPGAMNSVAGDLIGQCYESLRHIRPPKGHRMEAEVRVTVTVRPVKDPNA